MHAPCRIQFGINLRLNLSLLVLRRKTSKGVRTAALYSTLLGDTKANHCMPCPSIRICCHLGGLRKSVYSHQNSGAASETARQLHILEIRFGIHICLTKWIYLRTICIISIERLGIIIISHHSHSNLIGKAV